jgi:uncharacterized protein involved in response to NO
LEIVTLVAAMISLITYLLDYSFSEKIFSVIALALLCFRQYKLSSKFMFKDIMIGILNIAHLWLVLFFFLRVLIVFFPSIDVGQSSFHMIFSGAMASFALAIMTRAGLGHSGRAIKANKLIKLSFGSLTLGVFLRVLLPLFTGEIINHFLHIAMGFWTLAFILYIINFTPIFIKKRPN